MQQQNKNYLGYYTNGNMQKHTNNGTQLINIDGNLITNQQSIANSFNNYFLKVADKITSNIKNDKT